MFTIGWGVLLLSTFALSAQTFRGSITGVVADASGAAIAGASVKLENPSTGLAHRISTNLEGQSTMRRSQQEPAPSLPRKRAEMPRPRGFR